MIDNFEILKEYLTQECNIPVSRERAQRWSYDNYYVVELVRRGKDHPDLPAANYHFKNYYIFTVEDLDKYEKEIKSVCDCLKMRAYLSINYKEMSKVALNTLSEMARRISLKETKKFYSIFESCSGKYVVDRRYLIDVDKKLEDVDCERLKNYVNDMESRFLANVICSLFTKSGLHIICNPFNKQKYKDGFMDELGDIFTEVPEIKVNGLTLLYENV